MTRGWRGRDAWDWAVRIAAGLALVVSFGLGVVQYRYQWCKAGYDDRAARAAAARAAAAEQDRQAEDAMWQAFADAADPSKVPPVQARDYAKAAFARFLSSREQAREQRADNPLPAPPSQVCR